MVKGTQLIWDLFSNHKFSFRLFLSSQIVICRNFWKELAFSLITANGWDHQSHLNSSGWSAEVYWHPESGVMGGVCIAC